MGVIKNKKKQKLKQNDAFYAIFLDSQGHINSLFCPESPDIL